VRALLAAARPAPDSLIVLPEMFASGFSMNLAVTRQDDRREDDPRLASPVTTAFENSSVLSVAV